MEIKIGEFAYNDYFEPADFVFQLTSKKYLERWANVFTLMISCPDDHRFDISSWGYENQATACGTSACIAGHAGLHPWFRRRGLIPKIEVPRNRDGVPFMAGQIDYDDREPNTVFGCFVLADGPLLGIEEMPPPFDPSACVQILEYKSPWVRDGRVTTYGAAEAVRRWMLYFWPEERVEKAIEEATAFYDEEFVHRFTPWNADKEEASV